MFNSFSAALSALNAHSAAVDAVGHNLANLNTSGFKAANVAFKDVVAESMGGHGEAGMGVSRPVTVRNFSQGAIQTTTGSLDAALQGNGFFVTKDAEGQQLLTRDGSFQLDSSGYVVTLTGERVQKYVNGALQDIQVPAGSSAPTPTSNVSMVANLNAGAKVGDVFSTPIEVIDSLGNRHVLTFEFRKEDETSWSYDVKMPGAELDGSPGLVSIFGSTPPTDKIVFDNAGKLTTPAVDTTTNPPTYGTVKLQISGLADKAAAMDITWNFYDSTGQPTLTQFAQTSTVSKANQDGYPPAEVVSVGMADGGSIIARYGSGLEKPIGTLAIALVSNPSSLASASNNNFRVSSESSAPVYGTAATGGRGKVKAGALEASTVDIAREFTNLIVYQRGYQANSRVITTADEISQETLNLKR